MIKMSNNRNNRNNRNNNRNNRNIFQVLLITLIRYHLVSLMVLYKVKSINKGYKYNSKYRIHKIINNSK